jgi:hypothetical protein
MNITGDPPGGPMISAGCLGRARQEKMGDMTCSAFPHFPKSQNSKFRFAELIPGLAEKILCSVA